MLNIDFGINPVDPLFAGATKAIRTYFSDYPGAVDLGEWIKELIERGKQ